MVAASDKTSPKLEKHFVSRLSKVKYSFQPEGDPQADYITSDSVVVISAPRRESVPPMTPSRLILPDQISSLPFGEAS